MSETLDQQPVLNIAGDFTSVGSPAMHETLTVVILGNHSVPFSTESDLAWSFEKLGHKVIRVQENTDKTEYLLSVARGADLVVWLHTHGWTMRGRFNILAVIKNLQRHKVPVIAYHLDLWLGIARQKEIGRQAYWKVDHFFTVDKLMADYLNRNRFLPQGHFVKAGVVERDTNLGTPQKKFKHDVIFVGSGIYHAEWRYRSSLLNWLKAEYGDRFAHYGSGGLPNVRGKELNDLYASAKIVIGDTLCKNFAYPEYLSDRVFETTGRGGFIIHPYVAGIEDSFKLDEEIVTYQYGDFQDLKTKIDYYLSNPKKRKAIQKAGHARTKADHTYTNRVTQILKELGLWKII